MSRTVLITGATSGIGLELAKCYNDENDKVILLGRQDPRELAAPIFHQTSYIKADLTQENVELKVARFLEQAEISSLDLLIHNAALGYYGNWLEQSEENIEKLLQTNLHAPIALTHALLPALKKANGKVVFISSVAANLPVADYAVYAATKAALGGFARNLRLEHTDVSVQTIFPGATRTPMHKKSGVPDDRFKLDKFASPDKVAARIQNAIRSNRLEVTLGSGNTLLRGLGRYFAQPLDAIMRKAAS